MRYWVQPADGDHMGVSQYRDFLELLEELSQINGELLRRDEPLSE
jgi:hypothetical protein